MRARCAGGDAGGEYARQRSYLEKTIEALKRKLAADVEAHRADELRIMGQNMHLIAELNELRREIKVRRPSGAPALVAARCSSACHARA